MADRKERPTVGLRVDPFDRTISMTASEEPVPTGDDRAAIGAFDAAGDRFEERGELGRGGMGRVADVYDHMLRRRVAVKHVLARSSDTALRRFEREARITAQLEHPGIVPIYETGRTAEGSPYYVMRRVDGEPLEEAVRGATLVQRLALVPNVLAACDAVAYAHAREIVHRDLKPTNVLLGPFGETLVIDWGLACAINERGDAVAPSPSGPDLTRAGHIAGTPGFMSPEQARGEPLDARADVYALGATLFCVLAGEPPHPAERASEMIGRAAAEQPVDWSRIAAGVPDDLRAIAAKALASDPAARYPDAGALAADLRRFVTGNLVAAHRYGRVEQLRRFVRRHRAAVAVTSVSLAVIATVTSLAVRQVIAERDEATAAHQLETQRANQLTLAQARLLLETNPTLAVALVRPFARGERWREVRDVVAAASARGVPWRLPGSAVTRRAGVAADAHHAFSVGGDGAVWLYDLRARTGRIAARLGRAVDEDRPAIVALLDGARLALFEDATLVLIDPSSRRRMALAAPAVSSGVGGGVLYWIDREHRAWRLAGDRPARILVDDEVLDVRVSPDGQRFAIRGKRATWLVAGETAKRIDGERASAIGWDPSGARLVAVPDSRVHELIDSIDVYDPSSIKDRFVRGWPDRLVVLPGGTVVFQGDRGLWSGSRKLVSYQDTTRPVGLALASRRLIVAGTSDGAIDVFDGGRHQRLMMPAVPLDLVRANPGSPYVLAVSGPDVLVCDLDAVFPRILYDVSDGQLDPAGPHHVLLGSMGARPSTWIDLQTLDRAPGPPGTATHGFKLGSAPGGPRAVLIEETGAAHVIRVGTTDDAVIARDTQLASFADDHRIVLLARSGHVAVHDIDSRVTTAIGAVPLPVRELRASGDFVAVLLGDSRVVRIEIGARRTATLVRPTEPGFIHLVDDGRVCLAEEAALRCWRRDGQVVTHATLAGPITNMLVIDSRHLALDSDEAGYLVDLDVPGALRRTLQLTTRRQSLPGYPTFRDSRASAGWFAGLVAISNPTGGARLVDGITGIAWTVGQEGASEPMRALPSNDGSALYEQPAIRSPCGGWSCRARPRRPPRPSSGSPTRSSAHGSVGLAGPTEAVRGQPAERPRFAPHDARAPDERVLLLPVEGVAVADRHGAIAGPLFEPATQLDDQRAAGSSAGSRAGDRSLRLGRPVGDLCRAIWVGCDDELHVLLRLGRAVFGLVVAPLDVDIAGTR